MSERSRRAVIYARVSTKAQDTESQAQQLRRFVAERGWDLVAEYTDIVSGRAETFPQWEALLLAAHQQAFGVVVFWSLDRLGRKGTLATLKALEQLDRRNVSYLSFTEPDISTLGELGEIFISIKAAFARLEVAAIRRRTRAGLERARAEGKQIGRPARLIDRQKLYEASQGRSIGDTAELLKLPKATVARRLTELQQLIASGEFVPATSGTRDPDSPPLPRPPAAP